MVRCILFLLWTLSVVILVDFTVAGKILRLKEMVEPNSAPERRYLRSASSATPDDQAVSNFGGQFLAGMRRSLHALQNSVTRILFPTSFNAPITPITGEVSNANDQASTNGGYDMSFDYEYDDDYPFLLGSLFDDGYYYSYGQEKYPRLDSEKEVGNVDDWTELQDSSEANADTYSASAYYYDYNAKVSESQIDVWENLYEYVTSHFSNYFLAYDYIANDMIIRS